MKFLLIQNKGKIGGRLTFIGSHQLSLIPIAQFLNTWLLQHFWPTDNEGYSSFADKNSFCALHVRVPVTKNMKTERTIKEHDVHTASLVQKEATFMKEHNVYVQGLFEKFVNWQQCAAVMQREAVTVLPSCSNGDNIVVA